MKSYFFNALKTTDLVTYPSGYDREYDADDHAAFFARFFSEAGVFSGTDGDACKVVVQSGTTLLVSAGAVCVRGRMAVFDGTETITVTGACKIVARMDKSLTVRDFQLLAVTELTQTEDIYDLELASVTVSGGEATVTDTRTFISYMGQPAYYPPDSDSLPYVLWLYTLGYPMTAEQKALVEDNPSLMAIYNASLGALAARKADVYTKEESLSADVAALLGGANTPSEGLRTLVGMLPTAELHVLAVSGATVTATLGDKSISTVAGSDGWAILYPNVFGDWALSATINGSARTCALTVDAFAVFYASLATLSEADWGAISLVSEQGAASKLWSIGDTKDIAVNGVNYSFRIIGFDHDTKSTGGKAGITFQMVDCLATTYQMNSSATNAGGWGESVMRTSTMTTLLSQLPTALRNVIKPVSKPNFYLSGSFYYSGATIDSLFLLSEVEVFGRTTNSITGEGTWYDYYAAGNSTFKRVNGSVVYWWLRSPKGNNTSDFCAAGTSDGIPESSGAYTRYYVSFAFCV